MGRFFVLFTFCFSLISSSYGKEKGIELDSADKSGDVAAVASLYKPPVLPIDAKSLRMVNFHSAVGLPKGAMELFIQHRFGAINSGAYNWYGIDQSYMRIGLDYGLTNGLSVGASRSSLNTMADAYVKYQFVGNKKTEKSVKIAWYSNITADIKSRKNFTQEPYYYSNRLRYVHQLIISKNLSNALALGIIPSLVHINLVDRMSDANDIPVLAGFARLKISDKYSITAEMASPLNLPELFPKPIETVVTVPANPYLSLGLDIFTARHVFHLSLSNASSMNEGFLMVGDNGEFAKFMRFGFNIVRRW